VPGWAICYIFLWWWSEVLTRKIREEKSIGGPEMTSSAEMESATR
jgi:hypothetical protein